MKDIVAYIRGGLGDIVPAISAIKAYAIKEGIDSKNILVISDSVYYFRDNYSQQHIDYSLQLIHKLTNNVITVHPYLNNNFWLEKNNRIFDDNTNELSQEEADKYMNEFMFWRPYTLKNFVDKFINLETTFIDCLFTECILVWNGNKYERIGNERATFEFNPPTIEKEMIDMSLNHLNKQLLIHVRKKKNAEGISPEDIFYNKIIKYCNDNDIVPMIIGTNGGILEGNFSDLRGKSPLSFEGMCYLIDKCNVMLGNDSGFSALKLYQQQKDKLLIMNYPRWDRHQWFDVVRGIGKSFVMDASKDNYEDIIKLINEHYGIKQ
jgi:hypothetical protein